jgi:hypothetical protein
MSGRAVPHRRTTLAGLVVAAAAFAGTAAGQSPLPPVSPPGSDELDTRPPLPPDEPKRPSVAREYRYPNPNGRIYHQIRDHYPVQSEAQNRDEYQAWTEVVSFAHTKTAAGLEQHAVRDLTAEDLIESVAPRNSPTGRSIFRLDLVRLDGKLTKVREVEPTRALAERGLKKLYEGWLVPVDESPAQPVCVVLTDLPAGLELGEQPPDRWVSFAGYFFKVTAYPGPDADVKREPNPATPAEAGWLSAPLLVGRSVTLLSGPPAEATRIELSKDLRLFRRIRDNAPMSSQLTGWEEGSAFVRVLLHARKFPTAELEKAARRDIGFADLFLANRLDYKLDLVHFEGRLIQLRPMEKAPRRLTEAGVPNWYEGWLVPKDEPRGNPVCVIITELPDGLEPQPGGQGQPLMNKWVTFAGYSFKLMQYVSREARKDDPTKKDVKAAPLLLGRSVTLHEDPASNVRDEWRYGFVWPMVGGLAVVVGVALGLGWWFRRGDRRVKAEMDARSRNPFGEQPA